MNNITFISTIHKELGKCNAEELYKIIEELSPQLIFLEAVDNTYSEYEEFLFSTYRQYHQKLEIAAIQKYSSNSVFDYIPVCESGLTEAFHRKTRIVCQNREVQKLIDHFNSLAANHGFKFLNSLACINLQEEMRLLETQVLNDSHLDKIVKADIHDYENTMIRNINLYCKDNQFGSAILMCGAAHRKSIIEKIKKTEIGQQVNVTWTVFEN